MTRTGRFLLALTASTCLAGVASAQSLGSLVPNAPAPGGDKAPVNFTADQVSYDKTGNIVTASGHVRAIQNGQTLYADEVTLDRTTNVVTADGHVRLVQPTGETVYAEHATLKKGMRDAVMRGVAARLADNARMIANGARRTDAKIDELSKVVYSACDLCATDPYAPPTWQIHARTATRDLEHKMIEFHDATMEFHGFPVFYSPYMSQPDPSVKRKTGLLIPSIGSTSRLGAFAMVPYYIVIDPSSDITLIPIIATKQGPALRAEYRRAFNRGELNINVSGGRDRGDFGESIFSKGTYDLNDNWRAGFNYNHASNPRYLDDFSILPNASYLSSNVFLEGFGQGSYARVEAQTYQGLVASITQSKLPIVAPYAQYHFISGQDALGGQFSLDTSIFNVMRDEGTNTRRIAAIPGYSVPFTLPYGLLGTVRAEVVAAGYNSSQRYQQPNYSVASGGSNGRVQPYGAVYLHMPFIRSAGKWGTQIIEPEAQIVVSPNVGIRQNTTIPNEDSLDLEFSDTNLFDFNRYPGIDRLEGGSRVDYAMHAAWYLPRNMNLDAMVGQSYRFHKDNDYLPGSGLTDNVSDYVGHLTFSPTPWFTAAYRTRLNHGSLGVRMIDATGTFGTHTLNFTGGYLYTNTNPYVLYDTASSTGQITLNPPASYFTPRREFTVGMSTNFGPWSFSAGAQRNLQTGRFDNYSFNAGWQNNCFGANLIFYRRITSFNLDSGNTLVMLQFNFKTLGTVGFNAL